MMLRTQSKKTLLGCSLLLLAPWTFALGETTVDQHRPANQQGAVEISNVAGSVDVQGWDKAEVSVTGTIGKDVERVEVTGDDNRTSIRVVLPSGHNWGSRTDSEAHLIVHLPANSSLSTSLVSADLKVSGVKGDAKLQTVSGNVTGDVGGDVRANVVSGDIKLTAMSAKMIEIKAISGNIVLTGGNAETEVTTVSGDATVTLGTVTRARIKGISGTLKSNLALSPDAQFESETVSGDVRVDFASEPAADFDIQSFSGSVENCFGPKPTDVHHGSGQRVTFKTGDTHARVRISTKSGDVRMCAKGDHR
jgi:Putative adhesin